MAIGTALAIGSAAVKAIGAVSSFAQAAKQNRIRKKAEADAARMMDKAYKSLEKNYYDNLAVNKEAYELERDAMLSSSAQAVQAMREQGGRGLAGVSALTEQLQRGQTKVRQDMARDMLSLDKMSADEDARLRDARVRLNLAEAQGAGDQARRAEIMRQMALQQGFSQAAGAVSEGVNMLPENFMSKDTKAFRGLTSDMSDDQLRMKLSEKYPEADLSKFDRAMLETFALENMDMDQISNLLDPKEQTSFKAPDFIDASSVTLSNGLTY